MIKTNSGWVLIIYILVFMIPTFISMFVYWDLVEPRFYFFRSMVMECVSILHFMVFFYFIKLHYKELEELEESEGKDKK